MADDQHDRGPRDRTTINMNEGFELRYWSAEFGISVEQLRSLVRKVGANTDDVRAELARSSTAWRV